MRWSATCVLGLNRRTRTFLWSCLTKRICCKLHAGICMLHATGPRNLSRTVAKWPAKCVLNSRDEVVRSFHNHPWLTYDSTSEALHAPIPGLEVRQIIVGNYVHYCTQVTGLINHDQVSALRTGKKERLDTCSCDAHRLVEKFYISNRESRLTATRNIIEII